MSRITLRHDQIAFADHVARQRQDWHAKNGTPGKYGATNDPAEALRLHIRGCRGEAAAKLYLNPVVWHAYYEGDTRDVPDLGSFIDVKAVEKDWHRLLVHHDDCASWAYLLVSAQEHPTYRMMGWLWGHEIQKPELWGELQAGRPCYMQTPNKLRTPDTLAGELMRADRS